MYLLIKVSPENCDLYHGHSSYHGDSGLDLFIVKNQIIPAKSLGTPINLDVKCAAYSDKLSSCACQEASLPYLLVPRSSISKTPLRMSNSIGVIDFQYRGSLIAMVDNHSDQDYEVKRGQRYFQIISPTMEPISFELTDKLAETSRGSGGFGSTGR